MISIFSGGNQRIKPIKQDTFVAPRQRAVKKSHLRDIREKRIRFSIFPMSMNPC